MFRELNYPPLIYWEVTDRCNHECIHCFNYWRTDQHSANINTDPYYIQVAQKILERKPVKVVITGGEPFTKFADLQPAIDLLIQNGIFVGINTNCTLLNDDILDFVVRHRIKLFISFPSCIEQEFDSIVNRRGAFQKAITAMDRLSQSSADFSVNMVVSKINLRSMYDTARFVKDRYNSKSMCITRVSMPINARDHFENYMLSKTEYHQYLDLCVRIKQELGIDVSAASPYTPCSIHTQDAYDLFGYHHKCTAGKTSYVISSKGTVRACVRDEKEYGDILTEPFEVIWQSMREWRDDSLIPSECSHCSHRKNCQGGCHTDGLSLHGCRNVPANYSDTEHTSVSFRKRPMYLPKWDYLTQFSVAKNLQYVSELFGVRISAGKHYLYCAGELASFLQHTKQFTVFQFGKKFDLDLTHAISTLCSLWANHIIYIHMK